VPVASISGTRDRVAALLVPGGQALAMGGQLEEARKWLDRGVALGIETGSTFQISAGLHLLGWLHATAGDWDVALGYLKEGRELAARHELRDRLVSFILFEGWIAMYRGEYDQCNDLFTQAMELAERYNLAGYMLECQHNMAYTALMQGHLEVALSYRHDRNFTLEPVMSFKQAIDLLSSVEWWVMVVDAGASAMVDEDVELVAAVTRNSVQFLRQHGYRHTLAFAYRVNAMLASTLGQLDEARHSARLGIRVARQVGRVPEIARCLLWRGKTELRRAGNHIQGIHDIQEAARIFEQLGVQPELEQVVALLESITGESALLRLGQAT
jgi:tetratricopeptide (TPR) repeat protein